MKSRSVWLLVAFVVLAVVAVGYSVHAARPGAAVGKTAALDTLKPGQVFVRDTSAGRVAALTFGGARSVSGLECQRFATAGGTGVCLITKPGPLARTYAVIVDRNLRETRRIKLAGIPSRARVSASGRMVSWTVFVTGDAYNKGAFSTWSGIVDTRTGYTMHNIEEIPLFMNGRRYRSADVNYWGITFARDDTTFYATLATKGHTYLVKGDYAKWEARTLRENVECPSLSPDGTRLAFKKRVSRDPARPWRLYTLDLATMRETPLAERASVDDQAAWLDGRTVAYARPHGSGGGADVWAVPADGSGSPRLVARDASSPVAVR